MKGSRSWEVQKTEVVAEAMPHTTVAQFARLVARLLERGKSRVRRLRHRPN